MLAFSHSCWPFGLRLGLLSQLMLPATGLVRNQDLEAKKVKDIHMHILILLFNVYFMCLKGHCPGFPHALVASLRAGDVA